MFHDETKAVHPAQILVCVDLVIVVAPAFIHPPMRKAEPMMFITITISGKAISVTGKIKSNKYYYMLVLMLPIIITYYSYILQNNTFYYSLLFD